MAAEQIRPYDPDDEDDKDGASEEPDEFAAALSAAPEEPVTASELLKTAFVDDEDPRFPLWLPLPGLAGAAGWATYASVAQGGEFLATLFWPGLAIFALTTIVAWFGWQLEID